MAVRTLICTFGFMSRRVLAAMKYISYDGLVIVAGKDVAESEQLADLVALELKAGGSARTLTADPFDFADCMSVVDEAIRSALREGEVVVNISGGTKVLGDAALLAAFQNGVEAYHLDEEVVKLPVLKGVRFIDALGENDKMVLKVLEDGDTEADLRGKLAGEGISDSSLSKAVTKLVSLEIVQVALEGGKGRLHRAPGHRDAALVQSREDPD